MDKSCKTCKHAEEIAFNCQSNNVCCGFSLWEAKMDKIQLTEEQAREMYNITAEVSSSESIEEASLVMISPIHEIYQLSLKAARIILTHTDLPRRFIESDRIIQQNKLPTTVIPIELVCDCFLNRLSLITYNIQIFCLRLTPHMTPIDISELRAIQQQFLFHFDTELINKKIKNFYAYRIPFNSIAYEDIVDVLASLITERFAIQRTHGPVLEDKLRLMRFFIGASLLIHARLEQKKSITSPGEDIYSVRLKEFHTDLKSSIYEEIKSMIEYPLKDQTSIEKILALAEFVFNLIEPEKVQILCETAINEILIKEYTRGAEANKVIINQVISLIKSLERSPTFSSIGSDLKRKLISKVPAATFSVWFG
jgi:hypothetical protein